MKSDGPLPTTIDEYIAIAAPHAKPILEKIRATIRKVAPAATEKISYRMPTFAQDGNLVHFAAFKEHIGFYPPVHGDAQLLKDIAPYAGERGNLRFPLDEKMPYDLIRRIVKRRLEENAALVAKRKQKRAKSGSA